MTAGSYGGRGRSEKVPRSGNVGRELVYRLDRRGRGSGRCGKTSGRRQGECWQ